MASFTFVLLAASLVATCRTAPQNTGAKPGITIPEECKGKGFCTIRPHDYDEVEAKINRLLPPNMIEVNSRSGGSIEQRSEDDDNCPSVTSWESVYAYHHPTGTAVDIIVQTKLFPQSFAKVTCKHSHRENRLLEEDSSQCFRNLGLETFNLKSRCQESTATRTLLVYDPEVDALKMKNYTIPVCCSCQITKK